MYQVRMSKEAIEVGLSYPIEVIHITGKGIICKLVDDDPNTEVTAFIHISKLANTFVNDINDFVSIGDKLTALGVATDNGNELSLQHLNLKPHKPEVTYEKPKAKTIDEMIESANASYRDKSGDKGFIPRSKRRKPYKKPMYD